MLGGMDWKTRLAGWLLKRADDGTGHNEDGSPVLPSRMPADKTPTGLIQVFRAIQVLETAVSALPVIQLDDDGHTIAPYGIVRTPSLDMTRRELVQYLVSSLATDGNFFLLRQEAGGMLLGVLPLPPREVTVTDLSTDPAHPNLRYSWRGRSYTKNQVIHKKLVVNPTGLRGLGPIGSCRVELDGMGETRDFAANWRNETAIPSGVYSSEQVVDDKVAATAKQQILNVKAGEPVFLGKGLAYQRTLLSPEDMQFVESRKFDATQTARLFGIPANLMLTGADGSSLTYQNIEQSWIEFSSYTLAAYADPICEALGELIDDPDITVGMDWDSSRRSDTSTRYEALNGAVGAGWMLKSEARQRGGLNELPGIDDVTNIKEKNNAA